MQTYKSGLEEIEFIFKRNIRTWNQEVWRSEVQIPVQVRIFLLNLNSCVYIQIVKN